MTAFTLMTGPFAPSLADMNTLINQLNAMFSNVSVAGDEAVSGNLAVTGTTALTGNTAITGTLTVTGATTLNGGLLGGSSADIAINTNKFTVAAATGNTLIAGTGTVTGALTASAALAVGTTLAVTGVTTLTGLLKTSVGTTISAAGTTRTDATALTKQTNNLTTVASGTGVILPASAAGQNIIINNAGANAVQVYGAGSDTIDGVVGTTGVPLTNAKRAIFLCVAANTYISCQLGVVSA